jgi:Fe-S cluster assembly iron-binding protein IscA
MAVTKVTTKVLADDAVTIDKIADAALVTETEGISSNDNDTTIPTSAAVKDYVDTQDATKEDTITGAATTITSSDLTASKALVSNASGKVAASTVTDTELGYVSGVTSSIQDQFDNLTDNNTTYTIAAADGDNADEEKIVLTGSDASTDEVVLEAGTGLSIARSGDKITFTNTVTDTDTVLTSEQVEDIVGAMVTGNTETGITVTYDDTGAKLNFVVDDSQKVKEPHSATATTFTVTVDSKTSDHRYSGSGSSNGYFIDSVEAPYITLTPGNTYKFDQSDSTNTGHPLRFYYESDKTTEYTTDVTTNGTPGSANAYTLIVATDLTPTVLHYQCSSHALMGNTVNFDTRNLTGFDTDDLTEGTTNSYFTNERAQDAAASMITGGSHTNLTATYDDATNTLDLAVTGGGSVSEAFKTISVSGQSDVVADGATDTLTLAAGSNITLTTDAATDTITIASTASGGGGSVDVVTTQHTGDGSTQGFALDSTPGDNDAVQVYLNGVYQIKDAANYSISGSTLTFVDAPVTGTDIEFVHFKLTSGGGGGISWDSTVKTAAFTATAGEGYFVNTTSAAITVTLPSSPSAGDEVTIVDYAGTADTNNITITSSDNINGSSNDFKIDYERGGVSMVYVDATQGWIAYNATNETATALENTIVNFTTDFLVVAGGGGGSRYGGGGAGGLRTSYGSTSGGGATAESSLTLFTGTNYSVTVGAGGTGGNRSAGSEGSDSTFSTITSDGGGEGKSSYSPNVINGGSGGGGTTNLAGGTGTSGQGYAGGGVGLGGPSDYRGTGGGGAAQAGQTYGGGNGLSVSITGTAVTYAGGGGAAYFQGTTGASGGSGGGGNGTGWNSGAQPEVPNGTDGTDNLGGGGGGAMDGGSGVVIIRYPNTYTVTIGSGLTSSTATDGSDKVTTFTAGTGTISFS